jgi:hypothetical protein
MSHAFDGICLQRQRKTTETSFSIAIVPDKIRTEEFPNTCVETCRYPDPQALSSGCECGGLLRAVLSPVRPLKWAGFDGMDAKKNEHNGKINMVERLHMRSSITGSRKLLLTLASAVILSSESRGTHDHTLLSQDSWSSESVRQLFLFPTADLTENTQECYQYVW